MAQIARNIQTLGFRIKDVELILNSHVHFDHAGGIAELQRLSGAEVASHWSAGVLSNAGIGKGDPQARRIPAIPTVAKVTTLRDGQVLRVGDIALMAHFSPSHTPGGASWSWKSEQNVLLTRHPDASALWARLAKRREGASPDPMVASNGCRELAARAKAMLTSRLDSERRR